MTKRILTGMVGVPLIVASCLWAPDFLFEALIWGILLVAWLEIVMMFEKTSIPLFGQTGKFLGVVTIGLYRGLEKRHLISEWFVVCGVIMALVGVWRGRKAVKTDGAKFDYFIHAAVTGWLFLYVFGMGLFLLHVREFPYWGPQLLVWLLAVVWTADSAAYFIGTWWGRHKLLGAVSPSKTVEGLVGALAVPVVVFLTIKALGFWPELPSWGVLAGTILAVSLAAQAGDAIESLMKRFAGVKDSGSWIPGHGGLLDKLDSFLLAAPVFYYCVSMGWFK